MMTETLETILEDWRQLWFGEIQIVTTIILVNKITNIRMSYSSGYIVWQGKQHCRRSSLWKITSLDYLEQGCLLVIRP
jgi:hypothetical protein